MIYLSKSEKWMNNEGLRTVTKKGKEKKKKKVDSYEEKNKKKWRKRNKWMKEKL